MKFDQTKKVLEDFARDVVREAKKNLKKKVRHPLILYYLKKKNQ